MSEFVLDASALLVYLNQEKGSEFIEDLIDSSYLSTVNLSEVLGKLKDKKVSNKDIEMLLSLLPCKTVDFDQVQATISAEIKSKTASYGLSLGDRACLALAIKQDAVALTADKAWKKLKLGIKIKLVR